jgi:hypothetical protein
MTEKENANDLVNTFYYSLPNNGSTEGINSTTRRYAEAIQCALIAVDYIITSNPHSNPFNTDVHSTMAYWMNVKKEIQKL